MNDNISQNFDYSGVLITPHADYCLPGITRATVIALARQLSIPFEERRVSLSEFHSADEVFTTGTMVTSAFPGTI